MRSVWEPLKPDYEACDKMGRILGAVLAESSEIRVTTPLGTDIRGEVKGRPVQYETRPVQETGAICGVSGQRDQYFTGRRDG